MDFLGDDVVGFIFYFVVTTSILGCILGGKYINMIFCFFDSRRNLLPFDMPEKYSTYAPQGTPYFERIRASRAMTLFLRNIASVIDDYPEIRPVYMKYRIWYYVAWLPITIFATVSIVTLFLIVTGVLKG